MSRFRNADNLVMGTLITTLGISLFLIYENEKNKHNIDRIDYTYQTCYERSRSPNYSPAQQEFYKTAQPFFEIADSIAKGGNIDSLLSAEMKRQGIQ